MVTIKGIQTYVWPYHDTCLESMTNLCEDRLSSTQIQTVIIWHRNPLRRPLNHSFPYTQMNKYVVRTHATLLLNYNPLNAQLMSFLSCCYHARTIFVIFRGKRIHIFVSLNFKWQRIEQQLWKLWKSLKVKKTFCGGTYFKLFAMATQSLSHVG